MRVVRGMRGMRVVSQGQGDPHPAPNHTTLVAASDSPSPLNTAPTPSCRSGSIIFGGGQVVIPMLYKEVVQQDCPPGLPGSAGPAPTCTDRPDSWVTTDDFYTGLAVVQALPGPLFNFAAYLGAVMAKRIGCAWRVSCGRARRVGGAGGGRTPPKSSPPLPFHSPFTPPTFLPTPPTLHSPHHPPPYPTNPHPPVFPLAGILIGWVGLNLPGIILYYGLLPWHVNRGMWGAWRVGGHGLIRPALPRRRFGAGPHACTP